MAKKAPLVEPGLTLNPLTTLPKIHAEGAKVDKALQAFVRAIAMALREAKGEGDRAAHLVQIYSKLRTAQDILSVPLKDFAEQLGILQNSLIPEAFEREQLQTLTTRDGDRMTITQKLFASILASNRDAAYQWLKDNGHADIVIETVNASTLSAFARAEIAEGRELPEEIFTTHTAPSASLTRKK